MTLLIVNIGQHSKIIEFVVKIDIGLLTYKKRWISINGKNVKAVHEID